ncbi:MAG: phosphoribosylanthranilate isomerase [Desulfobacterales bacterium]|nr:phosphoribosylanthranilate isomerase [Desulfobacterales bacterium]
MNMLKQAGNVNGNFVKQPESGYFGVIVQIYEIQTPEEAQKMVSLGVDHIGSVLTGAESRSKLKETIALVGDSGARSSLIPLFEDMDRISAALDEYRPDIVHFCQSVFDASEDWAARCGRLISMQATVKERFPEISVMRTIAVPPPGPADHLPIMEVARHFELLTDFFLIDTFLMEGDTAAGQPEAGFVGITGQTCDWRVAGQLVEQSSIPVILAGGLSPDNVFDAVRKVRPAGVDSCTLTNAVDETGAYVRFKKDPDKVARFVEQARLAGREVESSKVQDER